MSALCGAVKATKEVHEAKLRKIERDHDFMAGSTARRGDLTKLTGMVKSQLGGFETRLTTLYGLAKRTDVYIDRYLPCRVLNMVKKSTEPALGDYWDRKRFLTGLAASFKALEAKILREEALDAENGAIDNPSKMKCGLQKDGYYIPDIEIPPTLPSEESEQASETGEDYGSEQESSGSWDRGHDDSALDGAGGETSSSETL